MAKLPAPKLPKKISGTGDILEIKCTAQCPECKELSSTQVHSVDIELDYGGCFYEGDAPGSYLQGTFWCDRCEASFVANTKRYMYS